MFNQEEIKRQTRSKIGFLSIRLLAGLAVFLSAFCMFGVKGAEAVTIVERSQVNLQPNEVKNIFVSMKNQTSYTWQGGLDKTALYLYGDKSVLYYGTWKKADLPAVINEKTVAPGQIATASFYVKAPAAPGTYTQRFLLGDGSTWHKNTVIEISFKVGGSALPAPVSPAPAINNQITSNEQASNLLGSVKDYLAKLLLKPGGPFITSGNGTLYVSFGLQNIGNTEWKKQRVTLKEVVPDLGTRYSGVRHDSWVSGTEVKTVNNVTAPGALSLMHFQVKAPAKKGNYTVRFSVETDGQEVPGGLIEIPVTVTADGMIQPEPVSTNTTQNTANNTYVPPVDPGNLPVEPIIRVGLYKTTDDILMVRGVSTGFSLTQGSTNVCTFNPGEIAKVFYDRVNGVYKATGPRCQTQSTQYYVAVAPDGLSPLEITDFSRPVSWLPGANDNKFRGKLELRFTPKTDAVWVINELPMEWYLKGIAETSDVSPMEFQKTLLVAARTYAMYHVTRATKHADEFYIVDAKYDQVYRGYGQEARSPRIVAGIDETRGIIVTHQGKIAITPYFSRSDGRTRSWSEVWYGEVEWCVGVPVPQDAGKTLWGHGVGMSASGALAMAAHESRTYDYILKYFYKGIELQKWYR